MSSGNYDITYYTDIESKQVDWLWYPYIPYGKLTILQGDPGDGKTTFILSIMALMSKNECLPFSEQRISGVSIYQNAEDDISDTIKPRLEQHKANCKNICFIDSKDSPLAMDDDNIEKAIRETGAKLLVLDPIQSFIGNNVDMNRANSIRPLMTKLKDTAQRTGCAIVLIGHLNKNSSGKSNYRGLGSIDITAASRSVLLIGKDPQNPSNRYLIQQKNNLAPIGETLMFRLMRDGVVWIQKCDVSADDILYGGVKHSKTDEATDLIAELLEEGPMNANTIFEQAEEQGISKRTICNAKKRLPIKSIKTADGWLWDLVQD